MNLRPLTALAALLVATPTAMAADTLPPPTAYYFPRPELCTVMVDFQKGRSAVESLKGDKRTISLVQNMATEFERNANKCGDSPKIRMLAVFIKGVDVYGRTDFGNRVNLLKLEAAPKNLRQLALHNEKVTLTQIKALSNLEIY
jgi:hypothetical protein